MGERLPPGRDRAPGFAAGIATAIEDALEAKLRAEGREPLPRGDGEAARDRRRAFLAAAEGAVRRLDDGAGRR